MKRKRPVGLLIIVGYKVLFAIVLVIAAVALWLAPDNTTAQLWAEAMTMILVGLGVVPEIYELNKGFTLLKVSIFVSNLAIFAYLVIFFRRQLRSHRTHRPK